MNLKRLLGKAICVRWIDAACESGWEKRKDLVTTSECETLGWLTAFDKKTINVAQSRGIDNATTTEVMAIPRMAVVKLRRVR